MKVGRDSQHDWMHRHFDVALLYWNVTVEGRVVDPLDVVGADTPEFSVLVHPIVWLAAEKS